MPRILFRNPSQPETTSQAMHAPQGRTMAHHQLGAEHKSTGGPIYACYLGSLHFLTRLSEHNTSGLPAACPKATKLPAATAPPLATAAADIMPEAMDPAAIPPAVKPMTPSTSGAATTAPAMSNKSLDKEYDWRSLTGYFQLYTRNSE